MSTIILTYPNDTRLRRIPALGLILLLISLALLAVAILGIVSSATRDTGPVDGLPVVQNLLIPVPVPTPPIADRQPIPSETPAPSSAVASGPSVVAVPVPTP